MEPRGGTGSQGRGVAMRMPRILLTALFSCVQRVRFIVYKALHVDIHFLLTMILLQRPCAGVAPGQQPAARTPDMPISGGSAATRQNLSSPQITFSGSRSPQNFPGNIWIVLSQRACWQPCGHYPSGLLVLTLQITGAVRWTWSSTITVLNPLTRVTSQTTRVYLDYITPGV